MDLSRTLPIVSRQLRQRASETRQIGYGVRANPEKLLGEKQELAAKLDEMAGTIDAALAKNDAVRG